jgi:hypothetical protein
LKQTLTSATASVTNSLHRKTVKHASTFTLATTTTTTASADIDPEGYGFPTFKPTYNPGFNLKCLSIVYTNQSITSACEDCLNAGCTWCKSGDYCYANLNDDYYCSSYESGDSSICPSIDLSGLASLIIIIIVLSIVLPCMCVACVIAVCCCGVSICGFSRRTNYNSSQFPQQQQQYPNGYAASVPMNSYSSNTNQPVVYPGNVIYSTENSASKFATNPVHEVNNPAVVYAGSIVSSPGAANPNQMAQGVIIGVQPHNNNNNIVRGQIINEK